jgi:hypothetical protein
LQDVVAKGFWAFPLPGTVSLTTPSFGGSNLW